MFDFDKEDLYESIVCEFLNKLFSFIEDRNMSIDALSKRININADKLSDWFDGEDMPNTDELEIIETFIENKGKQKQYNIEKQYIVKKFDEYRIANNLSYSQLKKLLGLKSKSAIHYWITGEKEPSDKYIHAMKRLITRDLVHNKDVKDAISCVKNNDTQKFTFPTELMQKSNVELSKLLDVSRMTIYNWKNSKKTPNAKNLEKIHILAGKSIQKTHRNTQKYTAEKAGIHRVTLSRWLNGKQKPRYENFMLFLTAVEQAPTHSLV